MTTLRIKTENFKEQCELARGCYFHTTQDWADYRATHTYREYLKGAISRSEYMTADALMAERLSIKMTEEDFRAELSVAALASYLDGASAAQVNYLASLAFKAGERRSLGYNRLTKRDASRAINEYLKG